LGSLHNILLDKILELHGTFYLPYRLHYSHSQLKRSYPQIDYFFRLKRKYDPNSIFQNMWYEKYS
jgi:FAD/FMN-containing dehydrogenase